MYRAKCHFSKKKAANIFVYYFAGSIRGHEELPDSTCVQEASQKEERGRRVVKECG